MNAKVILFLSCLVVLVHAQVGREVKFIIDPFVPDSETLAIVIPSNPTFPIRQDTFTRDTRILGGERDLHLEAESGSRNNVFSTSVSNQEWTVGTPADADGFAYMQYDGADGSPDLDTNGLGGVNFLQNGANAFVVEIKSDINTSYEFRITDMDGDSSTALLPILRSEAFERYELPYTQFNGVIDFTRVGSFEILINAAADVDTTVRLMGVIGPIVSPSPSPTPTPTRTPAASVVVEPSGTPSPSPTPSPSTIPQGPRFTWYTFDDDDNGREPCDDERPRPDYFFNDDNILYYYFNGTFDANTLSTTSGASIIATSAILAGLIALLI